MAIKSKRVNKVKIINCDLVDNLVVEDRINRFLDEISDKQDLSIDDIKFTVNGESGDYTSAMIIYHYTESTNDEGEIVKPVRKYDIIRMQNHIDGMIEDISEFLKTLIDKDNVEFEEFRIYEDHISRARDHAIIIYSYDDYQ